MCAKSGTSGKLTEAVNYGSKRVARASGVVPRHSHKRESAPGSSAEDQSRTLPSNSKSPPILVIDKTPQLKSPEILVTLAFQQDPVLKPEFHAPTTMSGLPALTKSPRSSPAALHDRLGHAMHVRPTLVDIGVNGDPAA